MGTGGSTALWPPDIFVKIRITSFSLVRFRKVPLGCLPGLYGQDSQNISTGKLHPSQDFHIQPINVVVFNGLYNLIDWDDLS